MVRPFALCSPQVEAAAAGAVLRTGHLKPRGWQAAGVRHGWRCPAASEAPGMLAGDVSASTPAEMLVSVGIMLIGVIFFGVVIATSQ